jgi:hypothetical protein
MIRAHVLPVAAFCLAGPSLPARADSAEPIRLDYRAPPSCPDEAGMLARMRARIDVRKATGDEASRRFLVTVSVEVTRFIGTITSIDTHGEPSARALDGTNCADVVDALALVAVMALHPELRAGGAGAESGLAAEVAIPTSANVGATVAVASAPLPKSDQQSSTREDVPRAPADHGERRLHLLGGLNAEATLGYVPAALLGTSARLELIDVSRRVVSSAFAIGLTSIRPTERQLPEGSAALSWTLGQLLACPVHFGLSASVSLLPCARVDIGRLKAVGQDIPGARSANLLWLSGGVLAQIAWIPVRPLVVDWQAAVLFPLTPYEFVFEQGPVIYGAPWIGISTSIGLGIIFL